MKIIKWLVVFVTVLFLFMGTSYAAQQVNSAKIHWATIPNFTAGQKATVSVRIQSLDGSGNVILECDSKPSEWSVSPKNRNPTVDEIRHHTPYLLLQLKIIRPKLIVTLGNYATKFALAGFSVEGMNKIRGIAQLHGTSQELILDGISFTLIPFYHPAAMLYNPRLREVLEHDFMKMGVLLGLPLVSDAGGQGALRDFM